MENIPYFYIYKNASDDWRWRFSSSGGAITVNNSVSYMSCEECKKSIESLMVDIKSTVIIGDRNYNWLTL
ncbi:hypothetical protein [Nissabacter sp. SGAir0207]|uniref:hypothetical protein n=1 Tax=Nissabacter sp. SGAir0207 TaxID=2126321 RepID=UPI0010CD47AE|nr:hypothetical protein [Nissabacter sp. SGAir0207]QCR38219.1 hypothetical protein C1N62_19045 [Nissabacter sp. SGAir0207]